jgi:hypothetical protein
MVTKPRKNRYRAAYMREWKYGLTPNAYAALAEKQDYACAICGDRGELVVDHDHETDEVRGLLCHNCNVGLGHFKDNPQAMLAAASYLMRKP